jgi:penicillin-binding protein 1A
MSFKKTFSRITFFIFSALITLLIVIGFSYLYMEAFLPDVSALHDLELQVPLKIYTQDGSLLAEFGQMQRVPLTYDKIPPLLIDAVVATEDQHFFEHHGVDLNGLARATWELAITGVKGQGGSTITMQVARNFYLSREKTFGRKFNEILLALKIDRELPKEKIMELYLNKIYLGKRAYGVEAAARVYFGKPLNQLSLPELAVIAGLPKAPSTINPIADPVAAKNRRDHVLDRMRVEGFIDEKTYKEAIATPLNANLHAAEVTTNAPYVAEMVRNLMETSYGSDAYTQGYKVYTTVNSALQEDANKAIRDGVLAYDKRHKFRGAEQNLGRYNKTEWEDQLSSIDSLNGLIPVAVTTVGDKSLTVMDANGQMIQLNWPALSWTKKKTAADIAKVGDVVRVEKTDDGQWGLSQLPKVQAALVSLDPNNGAIRSLVGGFSFFDSNFNRVTQATRQPGSNFKPFIYAAAFAKGYTLASVFDDAPISIRNPWSGDTWEPGNDDGKFWGPVRLRYALAGSRNTVSVRLLQAMGLKYALDYLKNFGFDSAKLPNNLTLALGTPELTPLQLATAYTVIANGGYQVSPYVIDRVEDRKGNVIYQANPKTVCENCSANTNSADGNNAQTPGVNEEAKLPTDNTAAVKPSMNIAPRAISPQVAFLVTQGLLQVTHTGTGAAVYKTLHRNDLAGKTGTTNDYVDAWFSGFNSDLETTVWVGFDKNQSLNEYGAQVAVPIWLQYMGVALAGKPEHTMAQPPGIVTMKLDPQTGAPVGPLGSGETEYFDETHLPKATDNAAPATPSSTDIPEGINPASETAPDANLPASAPVTTPAPVATAPAASKEDQHLF